MPSVMLWNSLRRLALARPAGRRSLISVVVAVVIGYPCFRFKIVGHYFALVTLALSEVTRLVIVALRDQTGGSLGVTPKPGAGRRRHLFARARCSSRARRSGSTSCWCSGWRPVGLARASTAAWRGWRSKRSGQEEDAAASVGIDVTRTKLSVTLLSAVMTCIGGVLYAQYQLYVNPETVSGIGVSLQMVFGVIAGGMFVMLGPDGGRGVPAAAVRRACAC